MSSNNMGERIVSSIDGISSRARVEIGAAIAWHIYALRYSFMHEKHAYACQYTCQRLPHMYRQMHMHRYNI